MKGKFTMLEWWSLGVAGALLLGLASWPYGFYTLLRLAVTVVACCWAYKFFNANKKGMAIIAVAVAVLFQPVIKIVMDRATWSVIDLVLGIALIILVLKRKR